MESNPTVEQIVKWLRRGNVEYIGIEQKQALAVYWQLNTRSRK